MHRRVGVTVLLLVVAVATIAVLSSGRSTDSKLTAVESSAASNPNTAAMRVFLDPETGEVGAQPDPNVAFELDAGTENALRYDDEGLKTTHHANGAVSVDLDGRYQSASVVRLDENGKLMFCTDSASDLEHVHTAVSTPAVPEVK